MINSDRAALLRLTGEWPVCAIPAILVGIDLPDQEKRKIGSQI
jgi:hypothetical protein